MRKRVIFAVGLALGAAAVAGCAAWAAQPCRPLDRLFGWSGCVGSFAIADLASLRRTLAFDPSRPDRLYAAGVTYEGRGSGDRLKSRSTIVALDFPGGSERWRRRVDPNGMPETLTLSPDGSRAALSCNRLTICDFAPALAAGVDRDAVTPIAVVDLAKAEAATDGGAMAKAQWMRPVAISVIAIDADGRSAEPRFSADGTTVSAGGATWSLAGDAAPEVAALAPSLGGWDEVAVDGGAVAFDRRSGALVIRDAAGSERMRAPLDLPQDFEPALHTTLAVSPDGARVAVLSRRFSGPGKERAILQSFRIADGARLARFALDVDASPALLFSPDGARLLVATAPEPDFAASTTVRLYPAGGGR